MKEMSWRGQVKMVLAIAALMIINTCAFAAKVSAQEQKTSAVLAEAAKPSKTFFDDYTKCVADLVQMGDKIKSAKKSCAEVRDRAARNSEKMANEAADSLKHSRPTTIGGNPFALGSGYSSYGYGNSGYVGAGGSRVTSCGEGGCNTTSASGVTVTYGGPAGVNRQW